MGLVDQEFGKYGGDGDGGCSGGDERGEFPLFFGPEGMILRWVDLLPCFALVDYDWELGWARMDWTPPRVMILSEAE